MAEPSAVVQVFVTDAERHRVDGAEIDVRAPGNVEVRRDEETGAYVLSGIHAGETAELVARAGGLQSEPLAVTARGGTQQVVLGVASTGELSYEQGDSRLAFRPDRDRYLAFVDGARASQAAAAVLKELGLRSEELPPLARNGSGSTDGRGRPKRPRGRNAPRNGKEAGEAAYLVKVGPQEVAKLAERLERAGLRVRLARPIRHRPEERPVGLTGELVVAFRSDVRREEVERLAAEHGLEVGDEVRHAGNAFLLVRPGIPDYDVLDASRALNKDRRVLWAEPNLVVTLEPDAYTPGDPLYAQLPHLVLVNADDAWDRLDDVAVNLRGGSPAICIGVVDNDGIAPNHPELTATLTDGTGKLVADVNFQAVPIAAQTVGGLGGDHGTECAGSATAAFDNGRGITGVAPNCHLIAAQPGSNTDAKRMADLYLWMAGFDNGSTDAGFPALPARPADAISSSFGVTGLALSNTMRTLFDHLTTFGRAGRGVVVCFSLGNSGYGDFTDPTGTRFRAWPTYERCIAVGSSINTSPTNPTTSSHPDPSGATNGIATQVDRRALYSPYGATALRKPDLVSPSHTSYAAVGGAKVDPILSSVRVGLGSIDGCPGPTTCNDYATDFGGTSHSSPTVAGAVALVLSARPELSWVQVRDILRRSCARIDAANANAIGQWQDLDGDGQIDYSRWYGSGRLDVDAAVGLALDPELGLADAYVRENLADTGDVPSPGWHAESPDIWVRRTNDPIPALAWGSPPPHQNPLRGADNYVYCRVRNRGTEPVSTLYLRASITHFPGFEFRYPQEFEPSNNVGDPVPSPMVPGTYLIGETRVDDLGAGADTIVKMTWPAAMIPPDTVMVGGVSVTWHPCLLLEVSPHDGPGPAGGVIAVRGDNNIAQRNIVIDSGDGDSDWSGVFLGSMDRVGIRSLVVDGTKLAGDPVVVLHVADKEVMALLARGARKAFELGELEPRKPGPTLPIVIRERTRLLVGGGPAEGALEVVAAPGTELRWSGDGEVERAADGRRPSAHPDRVDGVDAVVVKGLPGALEIPVPLHGGHLAPMAVSVRGQWKGELRLTQRRGDGLTSPGYSIRR